MIILDSIRSKIKQLYMIWVLGRYGNEYIEAIQKVTKRLCKIGALIDYNEFVIKCLSSSLNVDIYHDESSNRIYINLDDLKRK